MKKKITIRTVRALQLNATEHLQLSLFVANNRDWVARYAVPLEAVLRQSLRSRWIELLRLQKVEPHPVYELTVRLGRSSPATKPGVEIVEKPAATVTPPQPVATPVRPTPPPTVAENPARVEIKPAAVPVRQVPTTPPTVAPKAMPEAKPTQAVPVRREVRPVAKPAVTAKPTPLPLTTTPVRDERQREVVSDKAGPARLPAVETRTRNEARPLTNPEVKAPARVETAPTSPVKNLPAPPKAAPADKRLISPREQTRTVEPVEANRRVQEGKVPGKKGEEQTPRLVPTRPSR